MMRPPAPARGPGTLLLLAGLASGALFPLAAQGVASPELSLEEAIRLAQQRSPVTVAAETGVATASASLLEARGAFLPTVQVNGIYGNSSNQRFDQATGRLVSENYSAQAQASYEIFGGGRKLTRLRAGSARVDAAAAGLTEDRFQVALTTTELFYQAAAAGELVAVAQGRLERARQQRRFAQDRLELGSATRSDVLRAELEVGNAELALLEAESAHRSGRLRLGRQVGIEGEVEPEARSLPGQAPDLPDLADLVRRAETRSPAVLASRASLSESRAASLEAYTSYIPTLRVSGSYDWFSFDFPPREESWSLRLVASLPVFNGFQREAQVTRARAAHDLAAARARDAELQVRVAVEEGVQIITAAERRVAIAERSVELAGEDLRVQEERYQIGAATILELQTSQVALAEAESTLVRERQSLGVAVARLEAVLGERIGRSGEEAQ